MSRFETSMTICGTMLAFLAGHLVCCGVLPMVLNASTHMAAGAVGGFAGFDVLLALVTVPATAYGVTLWERHRHKTQCNSGHHMCGHGKAFSFQAHFLRNVLIGACAFLVFHLLFRVTGMPHHIPHLH